MAINERFEQLVLETDLNSPAPENEPARQAWFLARARMITQKRIKEEGTGNSVDVTRLFGGME